MAKRPSISRFRRGGVSWKARAEFTRALRAIAWPASDQIDPWIWSRKNRKIYRVEIGDVDCVVKEFSARRWRNRILDAIWSLRYWILSPPAAREWRLAEAVRALGLPTPLPVAVGIRRRGIRIEASLIVFERLQKVVNLESYLKTEFQESPLLQRRLIVERIGEIYRELHGKRIFQRDLGWRNILVQVDPAIGLRYWLIDFEEVSFGADISEPVRIRAFAQLNRNLKTVLNRSNRLRLYRAYLGNPARLEIAHREFIRAVESYVRERG